MHKRVLPDILKSEPESHPHSILDALPPLSHKLLLAAEEAVAVLYSPQNPALMLAALEGLDNVVRELQDLIFDKGLLPQAIPAGELGGKMAGLSVSGEAARGTKQKDVRKWFKTCFTQIHKMYDSVRIGLEAESNAT